MTANNTLHGKYAIITGGGRGIGRTTALAMAKAGANLVIIDLDGDKAQETKALISEIGTSAHTITADVSDQNAVENAFKNALDFFDGNLDILVANAGVPHHCAFLEIPLNEWERIIKNNLTSTFLCGQKAAQIMTNRKYGRIIMLGSISGQRGSFGRAAYGTSKAGIMQLTRVMAVELAPYNITVNAIAPGPIDTGITKFGPSQEKEYLARIPSKKFGKAEDVALAAIFLADERSGFITGSVINVDGGFNAAGLMFSYNELKSFKSDSRDNNKSD